MSAMQRNKGARGERELASLLTDRLGLIVKRRLGAARDGGHDIDLPGFALEVKRQDRPCIPHWWEQTVAQAEHDEVPALAYRLPRKAWRFRVPLYAVGLDVGGRDLNYTAELTLDGFCALVRESLGVNA